MNVRICPTCHNVLNNPYKQYADACFGQCTEYLVRYGDLAHTAWEAHQGHARESKFRKTLQDYAVRDWTKIIEASPYTPGSDQAPSGVSYSGAAVVEAKNQLNDTLNVLDKVTRYLAALDLRTLPRAEQEKQREMLRLASDALGKK